MPNFELFLDMDCCIYDLNKVVIKHYNHDYKDNYDHRQNKSYFWSDTKAPRPYFENLLNSKGIFYEGEPIDNAVEIINKLHDEGFKIYFVSLPLWNKHCTYEKVEWLKKHFKWLNPNTDIVFTGNKKLLDKENRILYDDNIDFLNWEKGINICFAQGWNEEFKGWYRVHTHDEFYKLVHKIELLGGNF